MYNRYYARGSGAPNGRTGTITKIRHSICLVLIALLLASSLLGGCAAPKRHEQVFLDVFDTVTTVTVYDTSEERANETIDKLYTLLQEYHRLYDIYHTYDGINNLATVNENAGIAPVAVDDRILDLIEYAISMDTLTKGRMNIAMGSVLKIWQAYREAGLNDPEQAALPPMKDLHAADANTSIDNIIIDRTAGALYLSNAGTQLDVGAIAKGYAAQRVIEAMREAGATSLLLSLGGNVCSIGTRSDGARWKVGIKNPYANDNLFVVQVSGQSVVTSGTYERFYTVNGKNYHHIINPRTLMPSTIYDSITVISSDSALADALTTGLFCMPIDEGMALVESQPDTEALWVLSDRTQRMSSGFAGFLTPG
jgi:thiamine biosynthesis lipoprotein